MFDDAATPARTSVVERRLCDVVERFQSLLPPGEHLGPLPDWFDVQLRESSAPALGRKPLGRVWLLEEGAAHREGPETELGRLLECGVADLKRAKALDLQMARAAADRARALAAFARMRPSAVLDRAPGEVGAASAASRAARPRALEAVSEWAADEVAAKLSLSPADATALLTDCLVLVEELPATLAALEQGRIGWEHARVLVELLAPLDAEKRAEVEARVLARAEGKTRTQLRVAARRAVLRADANAAIKRAAAAIRDREVRLYPGDDGMGSLSIRLPIPVARACLRALEQTAEACAVEGDTRTKAQRMADCFTDLILRPGSTGLPPVQVQLTLVAAVRTLLGGDEPGEIDGDPVPAAMVRELAYTLGLLPRPEIPEESPSAEADTPADAEPAAAEPSDEGSEGPAPADERAAETSESADAARARQGLADLLSRWRIGGTALAHRPEIAIVDELSGALLALTDAAGLRRGQGLGPPPESPGYRPLTELDRFVRLRDRRCRFPGCRARPRKCDLDHTRPWPWGPTSHDNLCCLCEHHHRLSHQAPGWQLWGEVDGGLTWRLPSGETITTKPPAFGTDAELPPVDAGQQLETPPPEPRTRARNTLEHLRQWTPENDQAEQALLSDDPPPF
jgi:hypothetical protein